VQCEAMASSTAWAEAGSQDGAAEMWAKWCAVASAIAGPLVRHQIASVGGEGWDVVSLSLACKSMSSEELDATGSYDADSVLAFSALCFSSLLSSLAITSLLSFDYSCWST